MVTFPISNDLEGPLTRFSRSLHFWSRISQKLQTDKVITAHKYEIIHNIWNSTMFGDFDWPLNASAGLSAIAEFLVNQFISNIFSSGAELPANGGWAKAYCGGLRHSLFNLHVALYYLLCTFLKNNFLSFLSLCLSLCYGLVPGIKAWRAISLP